MSIFATIFSAYVIPQEILMDQIPSFFDPILAMLHSTTLVYLPMFLRIFVQRGGTVKGYDNVNPRVQIARLVDAAPNSAFSRLHATHQNGLEINSLFLAAMSCGLFSGIDRTRLGKYGTLFLALRSLYSVIYFYQGKALSALRSILFLWSMALCANLMKESARKMKGKDNN